MTHPTRKNWPTRIKLATATALSVVPLLAVSPAATADPGAYTRADRAYLTDIALKQRGTLGDDQRQQIELGVATCGALRANPVQTVVETGIASGISGWDTGVLVSAAARNYCPDTWPRVRAWAEAV